MMKITIHPEQPPPIAVSAAAQVLIDGEMIIFPTDTAYGIGANIFNQAAVRHVFQFKKRPLTQPLSVFVSGLSQAKTLAEFTPETELLWHQLIPGPITLILPRKNSASFWIGDECTTIGLRCLDIPLIRQLSQEAPPFTATSANLHGQPACYETGELEHQFNEDLARVALFLDAGRLPLKPPSTVLDLTGSTPHIIRPGPLSRVQLELMTGTAITE